MSLSIKDQVLNTIYNHKNCTSGGVSNILNIPRFAVLRALSELIKDGLIKQQKGRVDESHPKGYNSKFRSYKLAKPKYTPLTLFND